MAAASRTGTDGGRPRPAGRVVRVGPGVAAAVVVTIAAIAISRATAATEMPELSPVFLAILGGAALGPLLSRSTVTAEDRLAPGLELVSKRVLRIAIVLLGLRFSVGDALTIGGRALGTVAAVVVTGLVVAHLVARWLRLDRTLALLIGVGTAICGNSAIAATAPIVRARDEEVSFASVVITGFGVVAMLVLPTLGRVFGLDPVASGVLAGAGVHDAAQAIAAGFLFGDEAGGVATVVKLARTAFLIPLVFALAIAFRDRTGAAGTSLGSRVAAATPLFALGFLLLAVVRSVGDGAIGADATWWVAVVDLADTLAGWLLVAAMAAMGLRTRLGSLRRVGGRAAVAGLVTAVAVGAVAAVGAVLTT